MKGGLGHTDHLRRNPDDASFRRWIKHFDAAAPVYASWGVEVLNASPSSALMAYQKVSLEEVVARPWEKML